MAQHNYFQF